MSQIVPLGACTLEPLMAYLKALGVFRLVSEQADRQARGWWSGTQFLLESTLDADGLVEFFLERYSPTPILAPWNKGSGFHAKDRKNGRKDGIDTIAQSQDLRFRDYRDAIESIRGLPELADLGSEGAKQLLVRACRNRLSDRAIEWMDAAIVLVSRSDLAYPAILGTGGNDGRLDFTNTFMCRVAELLTGRGQGSSDLLRNALFAARVSGFMDSPAGQFDPGRAGGFNQGPGIEHKDFPTNPWNLILSLEGGVAWASGVGRRQGVATSKRACSPFTVTARAVGYGSAQRADEESARAEIWTPVWQRPARFEEVRLLLREGRAEIGRRTASDGLEFAEAAASLGVDRGISGFVRYSLLERRGKAYLALPAGRFPVREVRAADLLEDLETTQDALDGFARAASGGGQSPPQEFLSGRRRLDSAVYEFVLRGDTLSLQRIVTALGRLEMYFSSRDPGREPRLRRPLGGLRPSWVTACDDGSVEYRLAAALASLGSAGEVGPLRANLAPIDPSKPWRWVEGRGQTAWQGNSFCARLSAVLRRRMMDVDRLSANTNPVFGLIPLNPEDASALCDGALDEGRMEELLFGLGLLEWGGGERMEAVREELRERWREPVQERRVPRCYALLKLLFLPYPLRLANGEDVEIKPEPSLLPLLHANRIGEACGIAQRRLFSSGGNPTRAILADLDDGTRLAAALLVPVQFVWKLAGLVLHSETTQAAQ
jgi:CRISPR-associated protein Csx17